MHAYKKYRITGCAFGRYTMKTNEKKQSVLQRLKSELISKLSVRRTVVYFLGFLLIAVGVSISTKSSLGVSPVNSIPYTVCLLTGFEQGMCTTVFFLLLIVVQFLISPKDFSILSFGQMVCSFVFGWFVTLANFCMAGIPVPESYPLKMLYIIISLFFIAVGVFLYINADLLPLPAEGVMLAFSRRTGIAFHTCKVGFDCSVVVIAALISLIVRGELIGVREGTVIAAVFVGVLIKPIAKFFLRRLRVFLGME